MRYWVDIVRGFQRWIFTVVVLLACSVSSSVAQHSYPVHVGVQLVPPYGLYLSDYYSGSRDRLSVTLLNRDAQQPSLRVRLRVEIKSGGGFSMRSREELYYPMLTLESGLPLRLTALDLAPYLMPDRVSLNGYLNQGRLPTGMVEFAVQAVDYVTGRQLSEWTTGRAWLETKQPPQLNLPQRDEQIAMRTPQHIRFQWVPRHQGVAQTEYEFLIKELPDNGAPPQSAFAYGAEVYRTTTRFTTLEYTHMDPPLLPGKRYAWQVRAVAKDGVDEIGVFDNNGFSEVYWFYLSDNCPAPFGASAKAGYRKATFSWQGYGEHSAYVVQVRPKSGRQEGSPWQEYPTFDRELTVEMLTPGWTYEYRVGAMCITQRPVFSPIGEVALSVDNQKRLAQCGIVPRIDLSNTKPLEQLLPGDKAIVGGDFPMRVSKVVGELGEGWFAGEGVLTLPWIFEVDVAVRFDRLRLNTDRRQIDGSIETITDPKASQIANTDRVDNGGGDTKDAGVVFKPVELDFTLPEEPVVEYNPETGEVVIFDDSGAPHIIAGGGGKNEAPTSFPMIIEDAEGNRYQINKPKEIDCEDNYESNKEPTSNNGTNASNTTVIGVSEIKELIPTIQEYDLDTANINHIKTAQLINKVLLEYAKKFGNESIVPSIKIVSENTSKLGTYNSGDDLITFRDNLLLKSESEQKHIVYHELAHRYHHTEYPRGGKETRPILAPYYNFINTLTLIPYFAKNKALSEGKGSAEAERKYNVETFAELYSFRQKKKDLTPERLKIDISTAKAMLEAFPDNEDYKTDLNYLLEEMRRFEERINQIIDILSIQ